MSSARAWQRAAKAAVRRAFPPDTEPEQTSWGRFVLCSVPLPFCFRKTPFRKDVLRPERGGKASGACMCFLAARLPRAEVLGPRRQVASSAGPRARLGAGGWRVRQAVPVGEGAAHRAGQEDLPVVALFFNHFLSLLVFIAHIFLVTVSPGFHPFQGAIFSPR